MNLFKVDNIHLYIDRLLKRLRWPRNYKPEVKAPEETKAVDSQQTHSIIVEILGALHWSGIHGIRKFIVDGHLLDEQSLDENFEALEALATRCRDAFAANLGVEKNRLHCSIKLCEGSEGSLKAEWNIWTLARSELSPKDPPRGPLGPEAGQLAGKNTAYAALTGCSDGKTEWAGVRTFSCFCCGDLRKHGEYVNARSNWWDYYKSGIVFPLRWLNKTETSMKVKGFLSFDSKLRNIFGATPCIFDYKDDYGRYYDKLSKSHVYHVGGIMADVLATTIALQDKDEGKEILSADGE